MITADILKRLSVLQLAPEAMQEVLSIIASCIEPQETRRRRDRDRKRDGKFRGNVGGNSAETVMELPPQHILPPQAQKPKKVSVSIDASEIPETLADEARDFALSKGWDSAKAGSEWQRFRDHGITKGRKHKGPAGLAAAWRNWVTSPYQNGASNGPGQSTADRSTSAAASRILDRLRALDAPFGEN